MDLKSIVESIYKTDPNLFVTIALGCHIPVVINNKRRLCDIRFQIAISSGIYNFRFVVEDSISEETLRIINSEDDVCKKIYSTIDKHKPKGSKHLRNIMSMQDPFINYLFTSILSYIGLTNAIQAYCNSDSTYETRWYERIFNVILCKNCAHAIYSTTQPSLGIHLTDIKNKLSILFDYFYVVDYSDIDVQVSDLNKTITTARNKYGSRDLTYDELFSSHVGSLVSNSEFKRVSYDNISMIRLRCAYTDLYQQVNMNKIKVFQENNYVITYPNEHAHIERFIYNYTKKYVSAIEHSKRVYD